MIDLNLSLVQFEASERETERERGRFRLLWQLEDDDNIARLMAFTGSNHNNSYYTWTHIAHAKWTIAATLDQNRTIIVVRARRGAHIRQFASNCIKSERATRRGKNFHFICSFVCQQQTINKSHKMSHVNQWWTSVVFTQTQQINTHKHTDRLTRLTCLLCLC